MGEERNGRGEKWDLTSKGVRKRKEMHWGLVRQRWESRRGSSVCHVLAGVDGREWCCSS